MANGNALSQLPQSQVRTMREGFQILDRDNDGIVNREDIVEMLGQLGKECSSSSSPDAARLGYKLTFDAS